MCSEILVFIRTLHDLYLKKVPNQKYACMISIQGKIQNSINLSKACWWPLKVSFLNAPLAYIMINFICILHLGLDFFFIQQYNLPNGEYINFVLLKKAAFALAANELLLLFKNIL